MMTKLHTLNTRHAITLNVTHDGQFAMRTENANTTVVQNDRFFLSATSKSYTTNPINQPTKMAQNAKWDEYINARISTVTNRIDQLKTSLDEAQVRLDMLADGNDDVRAARVGSERAVARLEKRIAALGKEKTALQGRLYDELDASCQSVVDEMCSCCCADTLRAFATSSVDICGAKKRLATAIDSVAKPDAMEQCDKDCVLMHIIQAM